MEEVFKHAFIASLVVVIFSLLFHNFIVSPNDFKAVFLWLPLYLSPIWGISSISYLSERGKKDCNT